MASLWWWVRLKRGSREPPFQPPPKKNIIAGRVSIRWVMKDKIVQAFESSTK